MLFQSFEIGEKILKASKKYYWFIIVMYMFTLQFWMMRIISLFQYWDEIYALLAIPLAIVSTKGKIRIKKENKYIKHIIIALMLFVAIGLLSNVIFRYQKWFAVMQDVFINLKFFLGIATTYYLFRRFDIYKYKNKINFHTKVLIVLFFVLVIQNKVTHVFEVADARFGISAEKLFFDHPTELASTTFFLLLILMFTYSSTKKEFLFVMMASFVILMTLRFKAIVTVMLFIYMYMIVLSGRKMKMRYLLPLLPFIVVVAGKEFFFYFFGESTMDMARGALTYTSLRVANDTFPLGAGFGTFASWMSGVYYSPLYVIYGINGVWGLGREWSALVSDVFWPMIIAQNGYIGVFVYCFIIYCLFRLILQCSKYDKTIFLSGMGALSYLLISSIAESAFVNPLAVPLSLIIGLCICTYKQKERESI